MMTFPTIGAASITIEVGKRSDPRPDLLRVRAWSSSYELVGVIDVDVTPEVRRQLAESILAGLDEPPKKPARIRRAKK